ncbi:SMP-30/gluconolactonase/LRE family protein [Aestuariispira insulae]|uniref:Gluconolactonase n=1 Tax=Aestuariispira insulae TaxID=1461337 RepID=A0A3D9HPH7_9PROT|nr:SMP-30/gluconolactonase/LRE family protein [Aestuariispira insulae]RED50806.1 gluconolactonase [Aestuariispira insulae]
MERAEDLGLEHIWSGNDLLGEGPLWDHRAGVLYWVDIEKSLIHRFDPVSGDVDSLETPSMVGSVALLGEYRLLAAIGRGFYSVEFAKGTCELLPDGEVEAVGCLMNDGKVDRHGRFLAGAKDLSEDSPVASVWRYDGQAIKPVMEGFTVFNGPAFSPDGKTIYFTDSPGQVIFRADYDPQSGCISAREEFARLGEGDGYPDGMTVDAEGCLWNAHWDGWRITRYRPDGAIDRVISMPVKRATSLCFGGVDLKTLFVTSACTRFTEDELAENPAAGTLFALKPGVVGLPEATVKE